MSQEYIVRIYSNKNEVIKTAIWNDGEVFGLCHPLRWVLERDDHGLKIRNLEESDFGEIILAENPKDLTRVGSGLLVGISPSRRKELEMPWNSTQISPEFPKLEKYHLLFKQSFILSLGLLTLFVLLSSIVSRLAPKKEEALIPPQFAQVILKSTPSHPSTTSHGSAAARIVVGLQSSAVKTATQNLLQSGALKALARSNLTLETKQHALSQQFLSRANNAIQLGTPQSHSVDLKTSVATLGGEKSGVNSATTGGSYGYGKVQGTPGDSQKHSFISLETPDAKVDEGLSQEEVGKIIHSHLADVRYCYESTLLKSSELQGKLVIDFIIKASGGVKTAKINQSSVNDSVLGTCLIQKLMTWRFPQPKGGIEVAVSYPFIFKTLGR